MTENSSIPPNTANSKAEPKPRGAGAVALDWWRRYCDPGSADPAVRARLRRCDSPIDAASIQPAVTLARHLGAFSESADDARVNTALNLARTLAHVREHTPQTAMRMAGWKTFAGDRKESEAGEDRPILSEARFRKLLTTGPGEEQLNAFVRLIKILDGAVDVAALSADFLDWSHPWKGERVRKKWAEEYYAARVFTGSSNTNTTSDAGSVTTATEDKR